MKINKRLFTVAAAFISLSAFAQQAAPAKPDAPEEKKDTASVRSPQAYKIDGIAAVVGNDVVLESDIEETYAQYRYQGIDMSEMDKCHILEQLLTEKLLAYQGEVDSLPVTESEINNSVNQRMQMLAQQAGSMNKLLDLYQKEDEEMLVADLTPIVRSQTFAQAMRKKITGDINPSPEDVRRFFNKIPKDSLPVFDEQFELATLIIRPKPSKAAVDEVVGRLKQMKKDVENGGDFRMLAILYSDDSGSAPNGGVYNSVSKGQFVKPFEAVAFNLAEGEISDPVETEFGYHIIQVVKRRGEQLDLRHILMRPKHMPDDLQKTQTVMDSISSKIRSGELKFDDAVKKYSEDDATKYNNGNMMNVASGESSFKVSELDRNMYYAVSDLQQGQLSDPVYIEDMRGGDYYAIYYVRKHSLEHRANYSQDFDKLKTMAKEDLQNRKILDWVSKKSKEVFIRINEDWKGCSFLADWSKIRRED